MNELNKTCLLLIILLISSCKEKNNSNPIKEDKKNINLIFEKRSYQKDTLKFGGGVYSTTDKLIKINKGSYNIFENYIPNNQIKSDTLKIYTNQDIVLEHKYHYYYTSIYQFKAGDTVKIDYLDGAPFLKITNRSVNDFDLNYQTKFNLGTPKPISREDFYLTNNRFRTKKEINSYNDFRIGIEKKRISNIDSLRENNLISQNAHQLISHLHKYTNPNLFFENYEDKLGIDSLLRISTYKLFLKNYSIYKFRIGAIKKSKHESVIDNLSLFDSIMKNKYLYSEKTKEHLLFTTIKSIGNDFSLDDFNKYYTLFKNEVKDTFLINKIKKTFLVDLNKLKLERSNTYLINNKNEKFLLSDILKNNKIVYIDFWASWCAPCRKVMPDSKKLINKYKNKDVQFVFISIDKNIKEWDRAQEREGIKQYKHSYFSVNYPVANFFKDLNIQSIPRYLLYNKQGELIHKNAPGPSTKELTKLIDKELLND